MTANDQAEFYDSGGSEADIQGAEQDLSALSSAELMELLTEPAPRSARPDWMVTRFPIDMEEYQQLSEAAQQPDEEERELAAVQDTADVDAAIELEYEYEVPEDEEGVEAAPEELAPPTTASFEGLPQTAWRPPDPSCAAGPNHVMVAVNTDLAIYNRTGGLLARWPNMTALFRNVLPAGASLFDPKVAYDHYTHRWIVVIAARRSSPPGSWLMLAVSQSPDPLSRYWVWALDGMRDGSSPTNNWSDYPMLGFDTQAIYIAMNQFRLGGGFQYSKLRILSKNEVYAGGIGPNHFIKWYDFWNLRNPDNSLAFTVQPAVHYRGLGGKPPAYLVNALWPGGTSLTMWSLKNPIGYWTGGPINLSRDGVQCRKYDLPPDALQRGSSVRIETNDARLLNAVYQNVGGTTRLWTCHTSKHTWAAEDEARSVLQWYEIDTAEKAVVQQNAYGASSKYYYFPVIQTDLRRNAYLVFGRSGANEHGSIRQTGRRVTDPANDLQSSRLVKAGESSYIGGRWGDYFGVCRDPSDRFQAWGIGEYADTSGNWGTWVCAMKF